MPASGPSSAGALEPGETPADAAARELREETGLTAQPRGDRGPRLDDVLPPPGAPVLASPVYERLVRPQWTRPADPRVAHAPVVTEFAASVRDVAGVMGLYAGGSLASGDYRPATSDLDLVAVVHGELDGGRRERLRDLHSALRRADPRAAKLHCVYVPRDQLHDVSAAHLTWAHGELYRRPLSGIGRAELLRGGITVLGPPPAELIPPVTGAGLRAAARVELSGYWRRATRKPWLWWHDVYVDLGLLTVARAEACIREDRLITKSEALTRLDRFGVPPELVRQIADRRDGAAVAVTRAQRLRRAVLARRLCAGGIRRLLRS